MKSLVTWAALSLGTATPVLANTVDISFMGGPAIDLNLTVDLSQTPSQVTPVYDVSSTIGGPSILKNVLAFEYTTQNVSLTFANSETVPLGDGTLYLQTQQRTTTGLWDAVLNIQSDFFGSASFGFGFLFMEAFYPRTTEMIPRDLGTLLKERGGPEEDVSQTVVLPARAFSGALPSDCGPPRFASVFECEVLTGFFSGDHFTLNFSDGTTVTPQTVHTFQNPSSVPIPAPFALLGFGMLALLGVRQRAR